MYSNIWGRIAYEKVGRTFVLAGDPIAKNLEEQLKCFDEFYQLVKTNKGTVCGYYFSEQFSSASPLEKHQAGVSLIQNLKQWSLHGGAAEEARRARRKGQQKQLQMLEIHAESLKQWKQQLTEFSQKWRSSKGVLQIGFLLSTLTQSFQELKKGERLFVCLNDDCIDAVISIRQWGACKWYIDQLMQRPQGYRFALDFLLIEMMLLLKAEEAHVLSLGFCPGIISSPKTWIEKILKTWGCMKLFYSPQGLYQFKKKYSSDELDRFLLLDPNKSNPIQLLNMERVTLSWQMKY